MGNVWKEKILGVLVSPPISLNDNGLNILKLGRCILLFKHGDFPLPCELTLGEPPKVVPQNARLSILYMVYMGECLEKKLPGSIFLKGTPHVPFEGS